MHLNSGNVLVYIIVTCRNAADVIHLSIKSIQAQTYLAFQCIVYDDDSNDRTPDIINELTGNDQRFKLIRGRKRIWAALARWICLQHIKNADPRSMVLLLDGDDWLCDENVLAYLINRYFNQPVIAGHGNFMNLRGEPCNWAGDYPDSVKRLGNYRNYPWIATHLRWFRLGVRNYLPVATILDQNGDPFKISTDVAFFLPILELSGLHTSFCEKVLYVYNDRNGTEHASERIRKQRLTELIIRKKTRLPPMNPEIIFEGLK